MANRPLLIIPPQFNSFEDMFKSKEYKEFLESEEVADMKIDDMIDRFQGIPKTDNEWTILVGHCNEPSILERFILKFGGQKI